MHIRILTLGPDLFYFDNIYSYMPAYNTKHSLEVKCIYIYHTPLRDTTSMVNMVLEILFTIYCVIFAYTESGLVYLKSSDCMYDIMKNKWCALIDEFIQKCCVFS